MSTPDDLDGQFTFTIDPRVNLRNSFALYLGGVMITLFLVILLVTFVHRRNYAAVVELTKPGKEWMMYEYLVVLKTSLRFGSSLKSHSRVSVQLKGAFHDSKVFPLRQDLTAQKVLHRGHTDIFVLHTPVDLGEIQSLVINISNWNLEKLCSWRPCFVEVIKSSTQERWGAKVSQPMICRSFISRTFLLRENEREYRSFLKLLMLYHAWLSPFHNPQRFGAYSSGVNAIFFFFIQAVLLITTLSAYISAHILTQDSLGLYSRSFSDAFLCLLCAIAVLGFLQVFEIFLRNIRPARRKRYEPSWSGLWQSEFPRDPNFFDIEFDWESSAFFTPHLPHRTPSKSSVKSRESASSTSSSKCISCGNAQTSARSASMSSPVNYLNIVEKTVEDCVKVAMGEAAGKRSVRTSSETKEWFDEHQRRKRRGKPPAFVWPAKFGYTEVEGLRSDGAPKMCFFCLWIKNLPVRGSTLSHYVTRLVHNVRRTFRALSACPNPELTSAVLLICIHQWLASLCIRMVRDAVALLPQEDPSYGDLAFLVDRLVEQRTILWYTEMGFRDIRPTESVDLLHNDKEDVKTHIKKVLEDERLTNMCSNMFFAILRYLAYVSNYYDPHVFDEEDNTNASSSPDRSTHGGPLRVADDNSSSVQQANPSPKERGNAITSSSTSPPKTLFTRHLSDAASEDRVRLSADSQNTASCESSPSSFVSRRNSGKIKGCLQWYPCEGNTGETWTCAENGHGASSLSDISNSENSTKTARLLRLPGRQWPTQPARVVAGMFEADDARAGTSVAVSGDTAVCQDKSSLTCFSKFDQLFEEEDFQVTCQSGYQADPYSDQLSNERNDKKTSRKWHNFERNPTQHSDNKHTFTNNDDSFAGVSTQMPWSGRNATLHLQRHQKAQFQSEVSDTRRKMFHMKQRDQEAFECWNSNDRNCLQGGASCSKREMDLVKEDALLFHAKNIKQCDGILSVQSDACMLDNDLGKGKRKQKASKPVMIQMCENPSIELETEKGLRDVEQQSREDMDSGQGLTEVSFLHNTQFRQQGAHFSRREFPDKIFSEGDISSAQKNGVNVYPECESAKTMLTDITEENRSNSSLYGSNCGDASPQRGCSHKKYLAGRRYRNQDQKKKGENTLRSTTTLQDEENEESVAHEKRRSSVRSSRQYARRSTNVWRELGVFGRPHRGPRVKLGILRRLCNSFYACANECFYRVDSGKGASCVCCHLPVCHTYSVAFSLLGQAASNVLTRLLSKVNAQLISEHLDAKPSRLSHRSSHRHSSQSRHLYQSYYQHRRSTQQSERSRDSEDSSSGVDRSDPHAAWKAIEKDLATDMYLELSLFFQKTASYKNKWFKNCNMSARSSSPSSSSRSGQDRSHGPGRLLSACPGDRCNSAREKDSSTEFSDAGSVVDLPNINPDMLERETQKITKAVIEEAENEVSRQVSYLVKLKISLAKGAAEAAMEIIRDMEDPIQVALRKFSRAKVVNLLLGLLPPDYEQDQIVSADEIRQRRQVRRQVGDARFDLEGPPQSPWDLEVVEDVAESLSARWMLNLHYNTHAYTLTFLARCLTLANLHQRARRMARSDVLGGQLYGSSFSLAVDRLSHAFEVEHKVAEVVDGVAGRTLAPILPLALSVPPDVANTLFYHEDLVMYLCEMVSVMEHMSLGRLSLAVTASGAEAVQDELIRLAWEKQELEAYKKSMREKKTNRTSAKPYSLISITEIRLIRNDLKYAQRLAETLIQRMENWHVVDAERYLQDTVKAQSLQVQQALQVMADARCLSGDTEGEYSLRELQAVEWVVAGQTRNYFPSWLLLPTVVLMVTLTLAAVTLTSLLASSLTPSTVGRWFGLHVLAVLCWGLLMEPLKLFWYMGVRRQDRHLFSEPAESLWSSSSSSSPASPTSSS